MRRLLLALAVGIVLADGSIVTLALPPLLVELDLTIEQLAAVIGVYTLALGLALPGAELLRRRLGARTLAVAALGLFGAASLVCAAAGTGGVLLLARGAQAIGGAGALVAAFELLDAGAPGVGRRAWALAATVGFAAGPALGGVLTELLDWRAIFIAQAPVAFAAAAASRLAPQAVAAAPRRPIVALPPGPGGRARRLGALTSLSLLSAALTAVLFGLVLLLVAGWAESPLRAAIAVSALPVAALPATRVRGEPRVRAAGGCALVAGGIAALAFLPQTDLAWAAGGSALAGAGIGLALPALSGELLSERSAGDAATLMAVRHLGITLALLALAPVISTQYDESIDEVRLQGTAVILDAGLPPQDKLALAPRLAGAVDRERPRAVLAEAFAQARDDYADDQLAELDRLAERSDDVLVVAIADSFRPVFLITAALAALAIAATLPPPGRLAPVLAAGVCAVAVVVVFAVAERRLAADPVALADPCESRELPGTGGISGFAQDATLRAVDAAACRFGSSREELVLALADDDARERYEDRYGIDPRSVTGVIGGLLFGP